MPAHYTTLFRQECAHDEAIWSCAWRRSEADGTERVVTAAHDRCLKIWRWADDKLDLVASVLDAHDLAVTGVDISPGGERAVTTSLDGKVRIWDLATGQCAHIIQPGPLDCWRAAYTPDGSIAACGGHGKVTVYSADGEVARSLETGKRVYLICITCSPDGKYLAVGDVEGMPLVFDMANDKFHMYSEAHSMAIRTMAFSPDSKFLTTGSNDRQIMTFKVDVEEVSGKVMKTMAGHGSWVTSVAYSPDNKHIASASIDSTVKIWSADVSDKTCVKTFSEHTDECWQVTYNSTGDRLLSVGSDRNINVYECPVEAPAAPAAAPSPAAQPVVAAPVPA